MDSLVEYARRSSNDNDFHAKFTDQMNKAGKKIVGSIDRVLNEGLLSPAQHGVAWAELLAFKLANDVKPNAEFVEQFRALASNIPARVVTNDIGKALSAISRGVTKLLLSSDKAMRAILPLKLIVDKMAETVPGVLSGIHTDLLLLVCKTHSYDLVSSASFLSRANATILSLSPSSWPMPIEDYLQFWYYLGNHHSALKQFSRACESYNMLLSVPTQGAVSTIQVEGYKKFILVSLLASGDVPSFNQRLTTPLLIRTLESLCSSYLEIAKIYRSSISASSIANVNQSSTNNLLESNLQQFTQDNNLGLIKQIGVSLTKKQISKLSQTYITFPLSNIGGGQINLQSTQKAGVPAQNVAERYVYEMICSRDIFAKVDGSSSLVRFLDDPEEYDTAPFIDAMNRRLEDVAVLSEKMTEVERELQLAPKYLIRSGIVGGGRGQGGDDIELAKMLSMQGDMGRGGGYDDDDEQMRRAMEASLRQQ